MKHDPFMSEAITLAKTAGAIGNTPVGCVIVVGGTMVGVGRNKATETGDPTAHAEIVAIRDTAAMLGKRRFDGATAYVTLEPCPMCLYALMIARVDRIYYGAKDLHGGAISAGARISSPWDDHEPVVEYLPNNICAELAQRRSNGRKQN